MHNVHFLCANHLYYLSKQTNGEPCHFVILFLTENFLFDRQPLMNCSRGPFSSQPSRGSAAHQRTRATFNPASHSGAKN